MTVDDYIQAQTAEHREQLQFMRNLIKAVLPDAVETLKWGNPAFTHQDGMILVIFSAHKNHMNLVATPSTKQAFESKLNNYKTGKGSISFPYDKPLPADLIKSYVTYRANEYKNGGVNWM